MDINLRFENLPNVLNAHELASFLGISRSGVCDLMHRLVTKDNLRM